MPHNRFDILTDLNIKLIRSEIIGGVIIYFINQTGEILYDEFS